MVLTTIFLIFILLILYLLFMSIDIFIDTKTNIYYIRLRGLAKASLEKHSEEVLRIKLHIFFMNFYFSPFKHKFFKKRKNKKPHEVAKRKKNFDFKKYLNVLKSFKVRKFAMDIDTGDCITNAKLYPVCSFLNHFGGRINVNFENRNRLVLHIHNRPIHILKSFFHLKT